MLESLYFVQIKNLAASFGQLFDRTTQRDPIDCSGEIEVGDANVSFQGGGLCRHGLIERQYRGRLAASQLHEHSVDRNTVQPSGEGRVSAERMEIAKHLQKSFLRQVLRVGYILGHLQAYGVNPLLMQLEQRCESLLITILRAKHEAAFGIVFGFSSGFSSRGDQIGCGCGNNASSHCCLLTIGAPTFPELRECSASTMRVAEGGPTSHQDAPVLEGQICCTGKRNSLCTLAKLAKLFIQMRV